MNVIRNFDINKMVGCVTKKINVRVDGNGSSELEFIFDDMKVLFHHDFQCCEGVYIESITGSLCDLIHSPLIVAEEVSNKVEFDDDCGGSETRWTFYKFDTAKGGVTVRWIGESNGYYSTEVDITAEINETKN